MSHRNNEEDKAHFRSERVFSINDKWFFQAREIEKPIGPFPTHRQAEQASRKFAEDMKAGLTPTQSLTDVRLLSDTYREDDF